MVDPSGFGGTDFETDMGDAEALVRFSRDSYDTPLKQSLEQQGFTEGQVELPESWLEDRHPREAVEARMGGEVYNLLTSGAEDGIGLEPSDLESQIIGACELPENRESDSRIVAQVFFPAEGYDIVAEERTGVGSIAYDAHLSMNMDSSWRPNADMEVLHYVDMERVEDQSVNELLFDGLRDRRHTLPEHNKKEGAKGYTGRMWVRYDV